MQGRNKIVLASLALVLLVAAMVTAYIAYKNNHAVSEVAVSAFTDGDGGLPYSDLLGNVVSLESQLGKVLVVTSWASWSPFSQGDLTMLNELASEYSDDQVVFMAINRMESKDQAARFMATQSAYPNLLIVLDPDDQFYQKVGGYAMPEVVVFDRNGGIILHERGVADREKIKNTLQALGVSN